MFYAKERSKERGVVMRTALLLIGLIVSSVSFAGDKQLTCLFFDDREQGLLDKGAWKSNKIIFNTDDFGKYHHFSL